MRAAPIAAALAALLGAAPFRVEHEGVRAANARLAEDPAGALAAYDAAERELGPRPELDLARGDALLRLGRADDARRAFALAARASGRLGARGAQNLAHALLALGDEPGAVASLRDAVLRDPGNAAARHDLELLLRRRAERERAGARDRDRGRDRDREPDRRRDERDREREREPDRDRERDRRAAPGSGGAPAPGPMSRADAERLLDAVGTAEKPLPLAPLPRRDHVAEDW